MSFFDAIKRGAQQLFEPSVPAPLRDEQLRAEFNLPDSETLCEDITAEVCILPAPPATATNVFYQGKLQLSQHFLVFRDVYDTKTCSFALHLSAVKKLERVPTRAYIFALSVQTYTGFAYVIQFIGIRLHLEQFLFTLKRLLLDNSKNIRNLRPLVSSLYSEYLVTKALMLPQEATQLAHPPGGLGLDFKFPGDARVLRDKLKMRLWFGYLRANGRNLTLVRTPMFFKLIRVGLPNRLRGEIWELCCGLMFLRLQHPGVYHRLLEDNAEKHLLAMEEIEKDLNRSLPEYLAYQLEEGILRLRRVLVAYSWQNPEIGYCQAMNILVAALLIYMLEEQAFWCLNVVCTHLVPGYYSKSMYGTLLDQKVFELMVETTMPVMWEHISRHDIQLSVVLLPWFLLLYLSSMPLVYATRIVDVFMLQGPRTLFQVALAIIRINGEKLLSTDDDGTFIQILKEYFLTLDQSAHPTLPNEKYRLVTRFQELLVVAFKEFSHISHHMVEQYRARHQKQVLAGVELFAKRTQLRNLPRTKNLSPAQLGNIYDRFYSVVVTDHTAGDAGLEMTPDGFHDFMAGITVWAATGSVASFLRRVFARWDRDKSGGLLLEDVVVGLNTLVEPDLMQAIQNFFTLYATDDRLDRESMLMFLEDLLALTRPWIDCQLLDHLTETAIEKAVADRIVKNHHGGDVVLPERVEIDRTRFEQAQSERYLAAASSFMLRAMEYAQNDEEVVVHRTNLIDLGEDATVTEASRDQEAEAYRQRILSQLSANAALDPNRNVYVSAGTFRMVILADETYELFFANTFREVVDLDTPVSGGSGVPNLRDMFDGLLADGKRVANEVRRRMDEGVRERGRAALAPEDDDDIHVPSAQDLQLVGGEAVVASRAEESAELREVRAAMAKGGSEL